MNKVLGSSSKLNKCAVCNCHGYGGYLSAICVRALLKVAIGITWLIMFTHGSGQHRVNVYFIMLFMLYC